MGLGPTLPFHSDALSLPPSLSFSRTLLLLHLARRSFSILRIDPRVRLPRCLLSMSDPLPPPCCSGSREGVRRKSLGEGTGAPVTRERLTHPGSLLPCRNSIYPHCFLISKNLTGSTHDAFSNLLAGLLSSLHLRKSGWPELRHLRVIFFLFFFLLHLVLLLSSFSFLFFSFRYHTDNFTETISERRCMEISERHSRILRGCRMNSRARIERVTMLYVVSRRVSIKSASYVMCGVSLFS